MNHVEMIIDYITDGTDYQYFDNHGVLIRCHKCMFSCGKDRICILSGLEIVEDGYCDKSRPKITV